MTVESNSYGIVKGQNTGYTVINDVFSELIPSDFAYHVGSWRRDSVKTPGYHKGFRSGKKYIKPIDLPMNGFSFSNDRIQHSLAETQYEVNNVSKNSYYLKVERGCKQEGVIIPSRSTADSITLDKQAASKMLKGLKDQSVNVAVALAEGRKTVDMIANSARRLAAAGFAVKKADFSGAARALGVPFTRNAKKSTRASNSVASNWLELQYGWLPLMSDIYGAAEFLAKAQNYVPRTRYTSSSSKTGNYNRTYESYPKVHTDQWQTSHTIKYVVYFSEPVGGSPPTALGLTNPLAVAWELVPFSFVVDWFLPVGTFLDNLDATTGLVFIKGCKTEFYRVRSSRHISSKSYSYADGTVEHFRANYKTVFSSVECVRVKLNGFPQSPIPEFRNPLSGRAKDFKHELNALALISQAFR